MKPHIEERLFSSGCLLVFIAGCCLFFLAINFHWKFGIAFVGLFLAWVVVGLLRSKRFDHMHQEALKSAFSSSGIKLPHLKEGSLYGFPTFKLTFSSEAELLQAEASGSITAFKQAIHSIYYHVGGDSFNSDSAVWATYEGWSPRRK